MTDNQQPQDTADQQVPDDAYLTEPEFVGIVDKLQHEVGKENAADMTAAEIVLLARRCKDAAAEKAVAYIRETEVKSMKEWAESGWDLAKKADAKVDDLQGQIDRLASYIMAEVEGEPSQSQSAVDTAIRIIAAWKSAQEAQDAVD